jgi:hypothetical protein
MRQLKVLSRFCLLFPNRCLGVQNLTQGSWIVVQILHSFTAQAIRQPHRMKDDRAQKSRVYQEINQGNFSTRMCFFKLSWQLTNPDNVSKWKNTQGWGDHRVETVETQLDPMKRHNEVALLEMTRCNEGSYLRLRWVHDETRFILATLKLLWITIANQWFLKLDCNLFHELNLDLLSGLWRELLDKLQHLFFKFMHQEIEKV